MTDRMTDRLRARVTLNGVDVWPDVLLARYVVDGVTRVDVWGRAVDYPAITPDVDPDHVKVAVLDGATIEAVPRKGKQRLLVTPENTYDILVLKSCCSAWTNGWTPPS